jgi:hypothetical protein
MAEEEEVAEGRSRSLVQEAGGNMGGSVEGVCARRVMVAGFGWFSKRQLKLDSISEMVLLGVALERW